MKNHDREPIPGLQCFHNFLSAEEETEILQIFNESKEWAVSGKRTDIIKSDLGQSDWNGQRSVLQYGYQFDYSTLKVDFAVAPLSFPQYLRALASKVEDALDLSRGFFNQCIINRYLPAANDRVADGIAPHADENIFYEPIVTVGLGDERIMTLEFKASGSQKRFELPFLPRLMLSFSKEARWVWKHAIYPESERKNTRYSITFRHVFTGHLQL